MARSYIQLRNLRLLFGVLSLCGCLEISAQKLSTDLLQQYINQVITQPLISTFEPVDVLILTTRSNKSMLKVAEVPKVFCYESLGFFCKLEHNTMKRGNFPLRFRLGEYWSTVNAEYGRLY